MPVTWVSLSSTKEVNRTTVEKKNHTLVVRVGTVLLTANAAHTAITAHQKSTVHCSKGK